jgi:hypothetical protein
MVEKVTAAAATTKVKASSAYITLNKTTGALQLSVPQGTTLVDALKGLATVDLGAIAKLPRGCPHCISGVPFDIRERYEPAINVRLGH